MFVTSEKLSPAAGGGAALLPSQRLQDAPEKAAAFELFYTETAPTVLRQVLALTRSLTEAQDCVQEAYARAWQRWDQLQAKPDTSPSEIQGWVYTVAYRCAVSRWRKTRNRLLAHLRDDPPNPVTGFNEQTQLLTQALNQLSPIQRDVLALHYLVDLSVEEVARVLDIPVNTVKTRLMRGRIALKQVLVAQGITEKGEQP